MRTLVLFFRKMKNFIVKLLTTGSVVCAILWEIAMIVCFIHTVGLLRIIFGIDVILVGILIYNLVHDQIEIDRWTDLIITPHLPKK